MTICVKCKHCRTWEGMSIFPGGPPVVSHSCEHPSQISRTQDPVTGEITFKSGSCLRNNGECPDFEERPPRLKRKRWWRRK